MELDCDAVMDNDPKSKKELLKKVNDLLVGDACKLMHLNEYFICNNK